MRRFIFILSLCYGMLSGLQAQAPQGFTYQAVARDPEGNVIVGQISLRFSLHEDQPNGTSRYVETHQAETNDQGIFSLAIGNGSPVSGSMNAIDWSHHQYYLQVALKTSGSGSYAEMGTTQLLSVPYALYAAESGSSLEAGNGIQIQNDVITNTGDLSSSNELQSLSINGNQLSISNGNAVTLPAGTSYSEGAGIDINGNVISAIDISPTNEIQTLSLNGTQLSLSNGGGSIQLPSGNSSWTVNGAMTYNSPTSNDVGIGADFNSNSKLNVISTGSKHGGNFTSPGTGDALRAYCNGTGAGIRASSLNGPGAVITTGAGDAGQFISVSGTAGSFTTTTGIAGYFSSSNGKGLIVEHGAVGIGTTTPTRQLDVASGYMQVTGPNTAGSFIPIIKGTGYYNSPCFFGDQQGNGMVAFFSGNGNYGLVLDDRGNGGKGTGLKISSTSTDWNLYTDPSKDLNFANAGTLRAWILDTDGSFHNNSDIRLKKDIKPFSHVLPGITKLQAYMYHMINAPEDSPVSIGFMAQEVEQQFPQMVVEKDGNKSLCYDQFAVLAIEAVKEQQEEITTLQTKSNALESITQHQQERIQALEQQNAQLQQDLAEIKKKLGM